jgi:hypothetical protein
MLIPKELKNLQIGLPKKVKKFFILSIFNLWSEN